MNKAVLKIILTTGVLAIVRLAEAQQAIFLVRHAEDVRSKDVVDRPLTESGQRRATLLASVLKDAGLTRSLPAASSARLRQRSRWRSLRELSRSLSRSSAQNSNLRIWRLSLSFSALSTAKILCCLSATQIPSMLSSRRWDTRTS
jgi:hypothetical protein